MESNFTVIHPTATCTNYGREDNHPLGSHTRDCDCCQDFRGRERSKLKMHPGATAQDDVAEQIRQAHEEVTALKEFRKAATVLDPNDPFDKVVINMVSMNRKKRRDYAADSDPFSNFRDTARNMALEGFSATEAAYALLLTKISRLRSLRANGRMENTANESVLDTYLDLAVYSVIVLALVNEQEQASGPQQSER